MMAAALRFILAHLHYKYSLILYKSVRRSDRLWVWNATFQTKYEKFEFVRRNKSNRHSFYIFFFALNPNTDRGGNLCP